MFLILIINGIIFVSLNKHDFLICCLLFQSNSNGATVLDDISDDLEFEETKVMQAQEELRSIRAKIAVLEGKMALEIMYALTLIIYASDSSHSLLLTLL